MAESAGSALVAYPHKAAAVAVKALRERGLKVVDLSADFRLDRQRYERWYQPHEAPELLDEAVYGLPEIGHRDADPRAPTWWPAPAATRPRRCWGCGRCASTCATPWWTSRPACRAPGREATQETHYVSAADNVNAYKTEGHRHSAELEQELPTAWRSRSCPT